MLIVGTKSPVRNDSQLIVCQSENESGHKIGFVKVEDSPVKGHILSCMCPLVVHVVPSDGRVTIETINLLVWRTGKKTHFNRIEVFWTQLLLCLRRSSRKDAKKDK
jgi:hypothetical protein